MKKDGDESLKETKLGMEALYKHLFKTDLPGMQTHEHPECYPLHCISQVLTGPWLM